MNSSSRLAPISEAGLQVPLAPGPRAGTGRWGGTHERTELAVELTKCGDKSDEDCPGKHISPFLK